MGQNSTHRTTSKESAELAARKREREHVAYENALRNIEQLAYDGIENWGEEAKNEALNEIADTASEVLER